MKGYGLKNFVVTTAHPLWSGNAFTINTATVYPNAGLGLARWVDPIHGGGVSWITPDGTLHAQSAGFGTKTIQVRRLHPLQGRNAVPATPAEQAAALHGGSQIMNYVAIIAGLGVLDPATLPAAAVLSAVGLITAQAMQEVSDQIAPNNSAFNSVQELLGGTSDNPMSPVVVADGDSAPDGGGGGGGGAGDMLFC